MSYFTIIDNYMASPINDKRIHEEHYTRRYISKLLLTLTVDRLSITTVNDNIHELCIFPLFP